MERVSRWLRHPDRFDWVSGYLNERGLLRIARFSIAGFTALFSASYAAMLLSSAGPNRLSTGIVLATTAAGGIALAVLWLWRWPTLHQSRGYVIAVNAGIAFECLALSDPVVAISGSFAFIIVGSYGALFHCAKAIGYNITVTVAVAATLLWRASTTGEDVVLAVCQLSVLLVLCIGAPVVINTMLRIIAADIARSDVDILTGLLNRGGFYRHAIRLIEQNAVTACDHLTVAMIDLDNFKNLNDTFGHAAGDRALIDVARALRGAAGPDAVVARSGGEEFLVAEVCSPRGIPCATRLADAVEHTPHGVTASVGLSTTAMSGLQRKDSARAIDELIAQADAAMYAAKAAGGNQLCGFDGAPLPQRLRSTA